MGVRLDKWLQVARVYKTRSQATRACVAGRVRVNDHKAKPHRTIAIGDRIEIEKDSEWTRILVVEKVHDKPLPKAQAALLFEDLTGPKPKVDPIDRILRRPVMLREKGTGRPTKRDRRRMDRFEQFEGHDEIQANHSLVDPDQDELDLEADDE